MFPDSFPHLPSDRSVRPIRCSAHRKCSHQLHSIWIQVCRYHGFKNETLSRNLFNNLKTDHLESLESFSSFSLSLLLKTTDFPNYYLSLSLNWQTSPKKRKNKISFQRTNCHQRIAAFLKWSPARSNAADSQCTFGKLKFLFSKIK